MPNRGRGALAPLPITVAEKARNQSSLPEPEFYFVQFLRLEPSELQSFTTCLYLAAASPKVCRCNRMFPLVVKFTHSWLCEILSYAKEP